MFIVQPPPGYDTSLHCAGNNNPSITWYKDNTLVFSSSPFLLNTVSLDDQVTNINTLPDNNTLPDVASLL